jgi:phosphoribosylformimino-5-aminoimidazole carboxamide ribotide isomerase
VRRIAAAVECPIQVCGGVRDHQAVDAVLDAGAARVVIGTAALRDPEFLDDVLEAHGDKVVVSVDARGGNVALQGWTEGTGRDVADTVAHLDEHGVRRFLCTEIAVDGTMAGPALEELERIAVTTSAQVIASGGVGDLDDLHALALLGEARENIEGAIVGRALYERRFTVKEGIAALRQA